MLRCLPNWELTADGMLLPGSAGTPPGRGAQGHQSRWRRVAGTPLAGLSWARSFPAEKGYGSARLARPARRCQTQPVCLLLLEREAREVSAGAGPCPITLGRFTQASATPA